MKNQIAKASINHQNGAKTISTNLMIVTILMIARALCLNANAIASPALKNKVIMKNRARSTILARLILNSMMKAIAIKKFMSTLTKKLIKTSHAETSRAETKNVKKRKKKIAKTKTRNPKMKNAETRKNARKKPAKHSSDALVIPL